MDKVKITTEYIELDKLLKWSGVAETGGQARVMIDQGLVYIDGSKATERRKKIFHGMKIKCGELEILVEKEI